MQILAAHSPKASPIRRPVQASSAIRNRSLARPTRAIIAAICPELRSWQPGSVNANRNAPASTVGKWPLSPGS